MLPLLLLLDNATYYTQLLREGEDETLCAFYILVLCWKNFTEAMTGKGNLVASAENFLRFTSK